MNEKPEQALPAFDNLWNYSDPAASERAFRELLLAAEQSGNREYHAELLTQIARSQGLQQKYGDALATLDDVDRMIEPAMKRAAVRSLLERGRVMNSSGRAADAVPLFEQALRGGIEAALDFHAVDAAHMLGIVCPGNDSLRWNEKAIAMAEASNDTRATGWLGALYNNTGWTYSDLGRYHDALRMFEKHLEYRTAQNNRDQAGIARWSIGKMHRMLGNLEHALELQQQLLEERKEKRNPALGYSHEEIAECLLQLNRRQDAAPHFAEAWRLLHTDPWLQQDEADRLARLKDLGGITPEETS